MSSSNDELGNFASGRENHEDERAIRVPLAIHVQQSHDFLNECINRCSDTSYPEHATRAVITLVSFVGSALFFFGVKGFVEETLGDDQALIDLGTFLGAAGLTLSALPLAGLGVTTAQDMKSSSILEQEFLELTPRGKIEYFLRALAGLASAVPIGGLAYYVLANSNSLIKWLGTITAFLGLAFGTVPSMLSLGKSAPNELKVDENLSAEQLLVLKRMYEIMLARIKAYQYLIAQLGVNEIPKNSLELLKHLLKDPAESYGWGLDAVIVNGTAISLAGMMGYAGSTGLFVNPLFRSLPNIFGVACDDITTGLFIVAFGNLMRLSCKGGFSDLYRTVASIGSEKGVLNFIKNEIYAYPFFPRVAPAIAVLLGVLGAFTGFTNAATCYAMTLPVLNAITFGYWEQWSLDTTTEVIRWVTAVCGFINSDFFNGRGSIIAVLNVFLLRYGHLFSKDENLKEVLKNFNGDQLYLRRLEGDVPVGKALLLLDSCGEEIIKSVLDEAIEGDNNPSITMHNWPSVVTIIKAQRTERISGNRHVFLAAPPAPKQADEETPLFSANSDPASADAVNKLEDSACCCCCAVM